MTASFTPYYLIELNVEKIQELEDAPPVIIDGTDLNIIKCTDNSLTVRLSRELDTQSAPKIQENTFYVKKNKSLPVGTTIPIKSSEYNGRDSKVAKHQKDNHPSSLNQENELRAVCLSVSCKNGISNENDSKEVSHEGNADSHSIIQEELQTETNTRSTVRAVIQKEKTKCSECDSTVAEIRREDDPSSLNQGIDTHNNCLSLGSEVSMENSKCSKKDSTVVFNHKVNTDTSSINQDKFQIKMNILSKFGSVILENDIQSNENDLKVENNQLDDDQSSLNQLIELQAKKNRGSSSLGSVIPIKNSGRRQSYSTVTIQQKECDLFSLDKELQTKNKRRLSVGSVASLKNRECKENYTTVVSHQIYRDSHSLNKGNENDKNTDLSHESVTKDQIDEEKCLLNISTETTHAIPSSSQKQNYGIHTKIDNSRSFGLLSSPIQKTKCYDNDPPSSSCEVNVLASSFSEVGDVQNNKESTSSNRSVLKIMKEEECCLNDPKATIQNMGTVALRYIQERSGQLDSRKRRRSTVESEGESINDKESCQDNLKKTIEEKSTIKSSDSFLGKSDSNKKRRLSDELVSGECFKNNLTEIEQEFGNLKSSYIQVDQLEYRTPSFPTATDLVQSKKRFKNNPKKTTQELGIVTSECSPVGQSDSDKIISSSDGLAEGKYTTCYENNQTRTTHEMGAISSHCSHDDQLDARREHSLASVPDPLIEVESHEINSTGETRESETSPFFASDVCLFHTERKRRLSVGPDICYAEFSDDDDDVNVRELYRNQKHYVDFDEDWTPPKLKNQDNKFECKARNRNSDITERMFEGNEYSKRFNYVYNMSTLNNIDSTDHFIRMGITSFADMQQKYPNFKYNDYCTIVMEIAYLYYKMISDYKENKTKENISSHDEKNSSGDFSQNVKHSENDSEYDEDFYESEDDLFQYFEEISPPEYVVHSSMDHMQHSSGESTSEVTQTKAAFHEKRGRKSRKLRKKRNVNKPSEENKCEMCNSHFYSRNPKKELCGMCNKFGYLEFPEGSRILRNKVIINNDQVKESTSKKGDKRSYINESQSINTNSSKSFIVLRSQTNGKRMKKCMPGSSTPSGPNEDLKANTSSSIKYNTVTNTMNVHANTTKNNKDDHANNSINSEDSDVSKTIDYGCSDVHKTINTSSSEVIENTRSNGSLRTEMDIYSAIKLRLRKTLTSNVSSNEVHQSFKWINESAQLLNISSETGTVRKSRKRKRKQRKDLNSKQINCDAKSSYNLRDCVISIPRVDSPQNITENVNNVGDKRKVRMEDEQKELSEEENNNHNKIIIKITKINSKDDENPLHSVQICNQKKESIILKCRKEETHIQNPSLITDPDIPNLESEKNSHTFLESPNSQHINIDDCKKDSECYNDGNKESNLPEEEKSVNSKIDKHMCNENSNRKNTEISFNVTQDNLNNYNTNVNLGLNNSECADDNIELDIQMTKTEGIVLSENVLELKYKMQGKKCTKTINKAAASIFNSNKSNSNAGQIQRNFTLHTHQSEKLNTKQFKRVKEKPRNKILTQYNTNLGTQRRILSKRHMKIISNFMSRKRNKYHFESSKERDEKQAGSKQDTHLLQRKRMVFRNFFVNLIVKKYKPDKNTCKRKCLLKNNSKILWRMLNRNSLRVSDLKKKSDISTSNRETNMVFEINAIDKANRPNQSSPGTCKSSELLTECEPNSSIPSSLPIDVIESHALQESSSPVISFSSTDSCEFNTCHESNNPSSISSPDCNSSEYHTAQESSSPIPCLPHTDSSEFITCTESNNPSSISPPDCNSSEYHTPQESSSPIPYLPPTDSSEFITFPESNNPSSISSPDCNSSEYHTSQESSSPIPCLPPTDSSEFITCPQSNNPSSISSPYCNSTEFHTVQNVNRNLSTFEADTNIPEETHFAKMSAEEDILVLNSPEVRPSDSDFHQLASPEGRQTPEVIDVENLHNEISNFNKETNSTEHLTDISKYTMKYKRDLLMNTTKTSNFEKRSLKDLLKVVDVETRLLAVSCTQNEDSLETHSSSSLQITNSSVNQPTENDRTLHAAEDVNVSISHIDNSTESTPTENITQILNSTKEQPFTNELRMMTSTGNQATEIIEKTANSSVKPTVSPLNEDDDCEVVYCNIRPDLSRISCKRNLHNNSSLGFTPLHGNVTRREPINYERQRSDLQSLCDAVQIESDRMGRSHNTMAFTDQRNVTDSYVFSSRDSHAQPNCHRRYDGSFYPRFSPTNQELSTLRNINTLINEENVSSFRAGSFRFNNQFMVCNDFIRPPHADTIIDGSSNYVLNDASRWRYDNQFQSSNFPRNPRQESGCQGVFRGGTDFSNAAASQFKSLGNIQREAILSPKQLEAFSRTSRDFNLQQSIVNQTNRMSDEPNCRTTLLDKSVTLTDNEFSSRTTLIDASGPSRSDKPLYNFSSKVASVDSVPNRRTLLMDNITSKRLPVIPSDPVHMPSVVIRGSSLMDNVENNTINNNPNSMSSMTVNVHNHGTMLTDFVPSNRDTIMDNFQIQRPTLYEERGHSSLAMNRNPPVEISSQFQEEYLRALTKYRKLQEEMSRYRSILSALRSESRANGQDRSFEIERTAIASTRDQPSHVNEQSTPGIDSSRRMPARKRLNNAGEQISPPRQVREMSYAQNRLHSVQPAFPGQEETRRYGPHELRGFNVCQKRMV